MTIAVGVKYPWGNLNRLLPKDTNIPEAIILASDSRFSRKLGDDYTPSSDIGTKLFQLGRDVAAVYAGISAVGEACIDELRWRLSKQSRPNSDKSKRIAQEVFQNVYKHNLALMKLKPDTTPLYLLIGACNNSGKAELYKASYINDFKLESITGLNILAWPQTKDSFSNYLISELNKQVEEEISLRHRYPQVPMASWVPMPIKAEHVAMLVTGILNKIIEVGSDTTIGGMVQCALITNEGISLPKISYTTDPTNEGPGWTRATARPNELITVTGISGIFSFYHLDT